MDQERISALLSLGAEDRYWYSIDRVAQTGVFWALHGNGGWLMPLSAEGYEYLALWPDRALAQLLADLSHPGHDPREITLDDFRATWIDELEGGGLRTGVFPGTDGTVWDSGAIELHDTIDDAVQSRV